MPILLESYQLSFFFALIYFYLLIIYHLSNISTNSIQPQNNKYHIQKKTQQLNTYNLPQKITKMTSHLDFYCGFLSGLTHIITGQPLDFVKTKYQISKITNLNISTLSYLKQIRRQYGISGLYRGSSSLFLGYPFIVALQFGIYQRCQNYFMKKHQNIRGKVPEEVLSIKEIMLSGALIGFIVSFLYCPIQYSKIQRQAQVEGKDGSFKILLKQLYNHQYKNIYKGMFLTMIRQTLGSTVYFASYQFSVRNISKFRQKRRRFATSSDYLISGSIAGLTFWSIIYPIDVIKTKIQISVPIKQIQQTIKKTAYHGFTVSLVRAIIVNGISFVTFQQFKRNYKMLSQFQVI